MTAQPRTTVKSIERAILGARAGGVEIGRVIVRGGGVVEIVAVGDTVRVGSPESEVEQCDDIFSKKARRL